MSARFLIHLSFLTASLFLVFFWTRNPAVSPYTLQLIAIFVVCYFINHAFWEKNRFSLTLDGFIFTMVTLLLVTQTGGLTSPLFFLIYILLFGLALLFDPFITLVFSLALILFFSPSLSNLNSLIQVIGLLLISPLALFFGRQYLKLLEEEEKIKILEQKKQSLSAEVTQQEEDTLLWLSLAFRHEVIKVLDASANMLADLSRLTPTQKENLQKVHESAKRLLKLGKKLKEKIEG